MLHDYAVQGFALVVMIFGYSYYCATQLDLSKSTYISNYNTCKDTQLKHENINSHITHKCTDIFGLGADICEEIYDLTSANKTKIRSYCERACNTIASPTTYEKSVNECINLFETYNIIHCISQDEFNNCIKDYETCQSQKFIDYFKFCITLIFSAVGLIFMFGYLLVTRPGI
jgi:hypothetical protein